MKPARALLVVVLLAFVGHAMPAVVVADGRVFRQPSFRARLQPMKTVLRPVNELPSVALTRRFLALCQDYGSRQLAGRMVAFGRGTGAAGLPASNNWLTWDADEMRAVVEYLEQRDK